MLVVWFAVVLVAGTAAGWLIANRWFASERAELAGLRALIEDKDRSLTAREEELKAERAISKTTGEQLAGVRAKLEATGEKIQALMDMEQRLKDTFAALSRAALTENSGEFLKLAKNSFVAEQEEARGELKVKHEAFLSIIKPVEETMSELNQKVRRLSEDQDRLANEAKNLSNALRKADIRGRWGELHLQRVAELAGMQNRCDFSLQQTFKDEDDRRKRPDMVVNLPLGRYVVVDSKAVMDAYITACESTDPDLVAEQLARHARLVREKIDELAKIDYATVLEKKGKNVADMVVCFIPGEAFFSAAISQDPTLLEYAVRNRVFLASPTILITLLRAIALGWRDHELSANADQVSRLGKELYSRLSVLKSHFDNLGDSIGKSVDHYNKMVSSLNSRVFPQARQFRDLKTVETGSKEIGDGSFIETNIHESAGADWDQPLLIAAVGEEEMGELKPVGMTLKPMEADDWQPGLSLAAEAEESTE